MKNIPAPVQPPVSRRFRIEVRVISKFEAGGIAHDS